MAVNPGAGGPLRIPSTTRKGISPYLALQAGIGTPGSDILRGSSPYPVSASHRINVKAASAPGRGTSRGIAKTARKNFMGEKNVGFGGKQPRPDPLGQLYMDLIESLQGPAMGVDSADLMAQITAAIDPVFNARQQAIENLMARAQERVGSNRQNVEQMYEDLSQDYLEQVPEAQAQGEAAEAEVEQLYGQLASNIEGHYSRIAAEQEEQFKRLGIEAAAPEVMGEQGEQQAQALAAAEQLGTVNRQRYEDIGNIDATYFREGAPLASLQGKNLSAEMLQGLEDYLFQREQDLLQLQGERSSEITSAFQQLMGSAQGSVAEQQRWQTEMLFNALENMQEQRRWESEFGLKQQSQMGALGGLSPQSASRVNSALQSILLNPNVVAGRQTDPDALIAGTRVPLTDAYLRQLAAQYAQQYGLSQAEYNALVQMLSEAR